MNTRQRENSKLKCFKHFILGHKKGKMFLTGKNQISFIFCFYKTKENILLQIQPLKMLNKHFLCADFRVTVKIFEALRQAKKQLQRETLKVGSYNNLAQHELCPIFLQNHSTLLHSGWIRGLRCHWLRRHCVM